LPASSAPNFLHPIPLWAGAGPPALDDLPPDRECAQTVEKEHGRIETRHITVSSEVVPSLDGPAVAQVCRIARTREIKGKISHEIVYAIPSLSRTTGELRIVFTGEGTPSSGKMPVRYTPEPLHKTWRLYATPWLRSSAASQDLWQKFAKSSPKTACAPSQPS